MPVLPIAAAIGAVAMVGGTVLSQINQGKALNQQKQAMAFERQKQDLISMRQKELAVRTGRQAVGAAQQAAENQGVGTSSLATGGQGSIVSQMNSNLSFLDHYGFLSDQAGEANSRAAGYMGKASMWGAVAETGAKAFSMAGGAGEIGKLLPSHVGPTPPPAPTGP